ncbi:hypothetical protein [Sulfuricurvum sp.]|uniref:hypothetical protein n=1 Tax=Sulfuricurvum sp. TaxID=2025608 RepID=UPI002D6C3492|nr:hypothetical protein [Sulfuricurvum sp.]HZF69836.1 hypothetical protein [Sulfuricurvum sp.]
MLKQTSGAIRVSHHPDVKQHHTNAQNNVVESVFHTVLIPLALSLGSVPAGIIYFIFTIVAYSTIFRAKSYYVFQIVKFVVVLIALSSAWFLFLYATGKIGSVL